MGYQQTIKEKMQTSEFFSFDSKSLTANTLICATELDLEPNPNRTMEDDHSKLIEGQYDGIAFPVVFKQWRKGKFNDILDTGWVSLYLISENLKNVLEHNKLTGWQIFSIQLHDLKGNEVLGYYGLSIVGRSGRTNYDRSEILEKRWIPHGPLVQYYKGVSFDKWDGSDFFIPDKTHHIFITEKAAKILKKNQISNLILTNISDLEMDVDAVKRS